MDNITITLKPYDDDVQNAVFRALFCSSSYSTETGLQEIPADSYQLVVSALDLIRWEAKGSDREIIKQAIQIVSRFRDQQKMRERYLR